MTEKKDSFDLLTTNAKPLILDANQERFPSLNTEDNQGLTSTLSPTRRQVRSASFADATRAIDFVALDKAINKMLCELTHELEARYPKGAILDKGDIPEIRTYLDKVYAEVLRAVDRIDDTKLLLINELVPQVYATLPHIRTSGLDRYTLPPLLEQTKTLTETLTYVMINNEIVRLLVLRYCSVFERPSLLEMLEVDKKGSGHLSKMIFHPRLVCLHYYFGRVLQQYLNQPPAPSGPESSEAAPFSSSPQVDDPEGFLAQIQDELARQAALIAHSSAWNQNTYQILVLNYHDPVFLAGKANTLFEKQLTLAEFKEELASSKPIEDPAVAQKKLPEHYRPLDLWIIIVHTFLFIVNNYGLAITSFRYAQALDLDPSLSGVIQAMNPLIAFFFGFLLNYITKFKRYYIPHICVQLLMVVANVLYFCAAGYAGKNNVTGIVVLVIGRVLLGFGGARLLTRKYISTTVEPWALSKYSAIFVGVSASGMCIGPGICALLLFYTDEGFIGEIPLRDYNIMAFMFIWVWILVLLFSVFFFKGLNEAKMAELQQMKLNEANLINFFKGVKHREVMRIFMLHKDVVEDTSENPWAAHVESAVNEILTIDRTQLDIPLIEEERLVLQKGTLIVRPINIPRPPSARGPHTEHNFMMQEELQGSRAVIRNTTMSLRVVHPFRWAVLATIIIFFGKVT